MQENFYDVSRLPVMMGDNFSYYRKLNKAYAGNLNAIDEIIEGTQVFNSLNPDLTFFIGASIIENEEILDRKASKYILLKPKIISSIHSKNSSHLCDIITTYSSTINNILCEKQSYDIFNYRNKADPLFLQYFQVYEHVFKKIHNGIESEKKTDLDKIKQRICENQTRILTHFLKGRFRIGSREF